MSLGPSKKIGWWSRSFGSWVAVWLVFGVLLGVPTTSAGSTRVIEIETTAYCGCGQCCGWERGSWRYLKLDQWNRYVSEGKRTGQPYDGKTASGDKPRTMRPGLFSLDSLSHPWRIPPRALLPWLTLPRKGTIAADTRHYPFGTKMYVPGWGWGEVQDRGGAIKGPHRIDLYMRSHQQALEWGRQRLPVKVILP